MDKFGASYPRLPFPSFIKGLPLSGFEVLGHKRSPWPRRLSRAQRRAQQPPRARCTCFVLPHADDCELLLGITQSGEVVYSRPGTFRRRAL